MEDSKLARRPSEQNVGKGIGALLQPTSGGIAASGPTGKKWQKPRDWKSPSQISVTSLARARSLRATAAAESTQQSLAGIHSPSVTSVADFDAKCNLDVSDEGSSDDETKKRKSPRNIVSDEEEDNAERSAFFELAILLEESKAGHGVFFSPLYSL